MPLVSSEETTRTEFRTSLARTSWSQSEVWVVAAGGAAMLLVVGVLDLLQLL